MQVAVGFILILLGQLASLKLKHIRVASTIPTKTYPEVMSGSDFSTFNHRGLNFKKRLATK